MSFSTSFTQHINVIINNIQRNDFSLADKQLNGMLNAHPNDLQLWHLKSITTYSLGRFSDSEFSIKKVLAIDPNHIPALENLAKLQKRHDFFDEAITTYKRILNISKNNLDTLFNLGVILNLMADYNQAELYLEKAYNKDKNNIKITIAYGQSLLNQDKNKQALLLFEKILRKDANNLAALNNKGIALKKLCYWDKAIDCLKHAYIIAPKQIEIIKNLASCYALIGNFKKSKSLYLDAISINELDKDAHHWLNQQLWENKDPEFLSSYRNTLKKHPKATELLFDMGHKLHQANDFNQAKEVLKKAVKSNKNHTPSIVELGVVLRELNELESSQELIQQAYALNTNNLTAKEELGKSYLSCDEPAKALKIFNELLETNPNQQGWLAYKTTALKLMGSAEYDYLCNYDHVLITDISPPPGYKDLATFNKSLIKTLRQYHHAKTNPLDQSLVTGSQTSEKLFDYHVPIIQELRQCFREQTLDFLARLPKDNKHPVLSKNTGDFIETDSWSVILHNNGFHKNHHHPAGWYSGPYYAQIPEVVKDSPDKQGWVKFGQPGFNMMTKLEPDLIVQPTEGMMVRFPSYFWHGTIPFKSSEERITVPGDIIPF